MCKVKLALAFYNAYWIREVSNLRRWIVKHIWKPNLSYLRNEKHCSWLVVCAAYLHTFLMELVLWTDRCPLQMPLRAWRGLVIFIAQLGKLKGIEAFGSISSSCFLFRWFILLYSTAVAYGICHFIFRKSQTENGDLR